MSRLQTAKTSTSNKENYNADLGYATVRKNGTRSIANLSNFWHPLPCWELGPFGSRCNWLPPLQPESRCHTNKHGHHWHSSVPAACMSYFRDSLPNVDESATWDKFRRVAADAAAQIFEFNYPRTT